MNVSVVMTTYNNANTCISTVASVLGQVDVDLELIVVDDCSNDFDILEKKILNLNDSRIKIYKMHKNSGAPAARNYGAYMSSFDILCFLDSDDIWKNNKLKEQSLLYKKKSLVFTKMSVVYDDNMGSEIFVRSEYDKNKSVVENLFGELSHNLILQTSSLMIGRDDFLNSKQFDKSLKRHQDYQFVLDLYTDGFEFIFVDKILVNYVKSKSSNIGKKGWDINVSTVFLNNFKDVFTKELLSNFLIVQLLGPSIKTRKILSWLKFSVECNCLSFKFFTDVLKYVSKRITS